MLKILVFIDWFYPAFRAGGPITSMKNFIDAFAQEYEFYVLTSNYDYGGVQLSVQTDRWLQKQGYYVYYSTSLLSMRRAIQAFAWDLLMINGIYSPRFSIFPLFLDYPKIVFPRGMLSEHSMRVKSLKKKLFVKFSTKLGFYKNVNFAVSSDLEFRQLQRFFPSERIFLIPNFVSSLGEFTLLKKNKNQLRIATIARLTPVKNIELSIKALQQIRLGKVVWHLYGTIEDSAYFSHLQKLSTKLPSNVEFSFKGEVLPFQIKSVLSEYHFLLSTTLGENFGHTIYESLSVARPVIISNTTPWRSLFEQKAGWDLPLEQVSFRKAIEQAIIMEQQEYDLFCKGAYELAKKFYFSQNKQIVRELIQKTIKQ